MSGSADRRISGRARVERNRRILRANDVCHICGHDGADTIDHIVPLARGGTEHPSNLAPAHGACNRAKSDKPFAAIVKRSGSLS